MKWSNKDPRQTDKKRLLVMIERIGAPPGFTEMYVGDDGKVWRENWGCLLAQDAAWDESWYWIPMPEKAFS